MRNRGLLICTVVVLLWAAQQAFGAIIRVKWDSPMSGPGTSWENAYHTVTAALSSSVSGDEVWVARGTYVECITLKSGVGLYGGFSGTESDRPQRNWSASRAVLDGNGAGSVIISPMGVTGARIDGFVIRNGKGTNGGGISCLGSSVVISNNTITGNSASNSGGGLWCNACSPTVTNNVIMGNSTAGSGGGIYSYGSASSTPTIANNTIIANLASRGGGIFADRTSPTIANNIVASNSSGIFKNGSSGVPVLRNNCVYNPDGANYTGATVGTGDIQVDPRLVAVEYGQVHVQANSPCRDAGADDVVQADWADMDAQARIQGTHVDIGADESDGGTSTYTPAVVRVSLSGNDTDDGSDWTKAKRTIQSAIDTASVRGGEVWVAEGVYDERVTLWPCCYLYGGFAGTETARTERNWSANVTVVDGGAGGSVITAFTGHRVTASGIDGFTIRNGKAKSGGGIYCGASPMIANNTITANGTTARYSSEGNGGGIYCSGSSAPVISHNMIAANVASKGGGIYCDSSSATISSNGIVANSAESGAGVYCKQGTPTVLNNTIASNATGPSGQGGGVYCDASAFIAGNTIAENSSRDGAGAYFASGYTEVTNNTIVSNAPDALCCNVNSSPNIRNNIIAFSPSGVKSEDSRMSLASNCIYIPGGASHTGITDIQADPKLVNAGYGQVHIQPDSPCRNAGLDSVVQPSWVDMDGQARIQGTHVDIGADESDGSTWAYAPTVIRVTSSGSDCNDGSSWALAKRTVQAGIFEAFARGGEVWVAAGTYTERVVLTAHTFAYGGFAGTETLRAERSPRSNVTTLNGGAGGSVVLAQTGASTTSGLDGFTITNGSESGVRCCTFSQPTISNNVIAANTADPDGGGIHCDYCSPSILHNTIVSNHANQRGGAIYCGGDYLGMPTISGNTITANSAADGGAIGCRGASVIVDNVICQNRAARGGGMYCLYGSKASVSNNTIVANIASVGTRSSDGGGLYCESSSSLVMSNNVVAFNSSGLYATASSPSGRNNCVYNPGGYNYSGVSPGIGDISLDPLFVGRERGDFHLLAASPCIGAGWSGAAGIPSLDMDGEARVNGVIDIGADEYWPGIARAIGDGKSIASGSAMDLYGYVVSAAFDGFFYVESDDRACGLRVSRPGHSLHAGDRARVSGIAGVTSDAECCIEATAAYAVGAGSVAPLGIANGSVGGGPSGLQQGMYGSNGLNNIGLLVRTSGRIVDVEQATTPTWIRIDDGSGVDVKCGIPSGVVIDPAWQYVSVTGISSCEKVGDTLARLIRVRGQADIAGY